MADFVERYAPDRIGTPFQQAHSLLNLTGNLLAEEGFDIEEHNRLWKEFYPPVDEAAEAVLDMSCRGRKVPEELLRAARHEDEDVERDFAGNEAKETPK